MKYDERLDCRDRFYVCANCGKTFYIPITTSTEEYVYKINRQRKEQGRKYTEQSYCCSWSCFNKMRANHRENIQHK